MGHMGKLSQNAYLWYVYPYTASLGFVGPKFSEKKLIGLAYAFEQATQASRDFHCTCLSYG